LFNLNSSCMRLLMLDKARSVIHLEDVESCLKEVLFKVVFNTQKRHRKQLVVPIIYVSSDPIDFLEDYKDSLMYRYVVDFLCNSIILLDITLPPPQPEATLSTTNVPEGGTIMKIISIEEDKRKIQVQVNKRIKLVQLKKELAPLIGVPPAGFRMYGIRNNEEYEMKRLHETLRDIKSGSKLTVRLGRALGKRERRIKLYLLQVNNTDFCKYMMEFIAAKGTPVREFKKQIIEEAEVQGIDCDLELDKMRLRYKNGVNPGTVYLDHQMIDATKETYYVEPLKGQSIFSFKL
uniref:Ubiquitin carboxyl-terminal hydrolase 47 C-terminal domain-containing protein n=2 Tax=Amphimedon queenslandica TaxID=400682 RepID=A0A1X7SV31_AMPQE